MKKPWQRTCPNCRRHLEMYPLPKRTEWVAVLRPIIPCWACGARLRVTRVSLALQCLLLGAGLVVFALSPLWAVLYFAVMWWPFIQLPLEVCR